MGRISALTFSLAFLGTLGIASSRGLAGQVIPPPAPGIDSVTVTPGAIYAAGGIYSALMGQCYRDLWTTPIRVPVANLSTFAGGLTPMRVGGGMTTQTLHLRGGDGRRYVFRSVHKTPRELLEALGGTTLAAVVQDQMCSFHPSGAMVVARLLEAVGALHTDPKLVVVPDDPRLGEFRQQFAGMLVLFEERPDDGPDGSAGFAGSTMIKQTDRLFRELEEDPRNHLDAVELLRVRLVDLLVGDRDRSHNNHLWARFDDDDGGWLWRVIPRDRDQAFVRFDGMLKSVARLYERRLVSFGATFSNIHAVTRNAWDIDRNLLVGIDRETWFAQVGEVQAALTDDVIAAALATMPREHVELVGAELGVALRNRRDHLREAAEVLYSIVFGVADVHATDVAEEMVLERLATGGVALTISPIGRDGGPSYTRTFAPSETSELRIYLHGGDDRAVFRGSSDGEIRVRIIGGGGTDRFTGSVSGGASRTVLYDGNGDTEFGVAGNVSIVRSSAPRPFSWFNDSRTLDWGSLWIPSASASYDADRGLVLIPGFLYHRYGFLKDPFHHRIQASAGYAFGATEPIIDYRHLVRSGLGSADLSFHGSWSGVEIFSYYGPGNESVAAGPTGFHRVLHKQVVLEGAVRFGNGNRSFVELGSAYTYMSTDTTTGTNFLATGRPYGSGSFSYAGVRTTLKIDTRDMAGTPTSGISMSVGAAFYPAILDADRGSFGEMHGQAAVYISPSGGNPTLALRASGKKLWGPYPFSESAFLGGPTDLRGLRRQRFAGDAALLGSAELRLFLARSFILFPSDIGVFAFSDAGRVYLGGESSETWHSSFGAGIWLAPVKRSSTVQFSLARSAGETAFLAGVGFAY